MSEIEKTILLLLVGAVISFVPTLIVSILLHVWALKDRKSERKFDAREVRLKEGEEIIRIYTREVYYFAQSVFQLIKINNPSEIKKAIKIITEYFDSMEEEDKGKAIYEVSVKSLGDEQLTNVWDSIIDSFNAYKKYCLSLSQLLHREGLKPFQEQRDKHNEEEKALREDYYSSVTEFYKRINELRSQ